MKFLEDFKTFITKGNVIDLAVAVIIGGAFNKVVSSFVNDIVMPPIGLALGRVNFADLKIVLQDATEAAPEVAIKYGAFVQNIIDLILVGLAVFVIVKIYTKLQSLKKHEAAVNPPALTKQEELLTEIRDILELSRKQS